jgi:hypothetical protein
MPSYVILSHVGIVRTSVSEELIASLIRVTRIGELGNHWRVAKKKKNAVFWYLTPCGFCRNRYFGGTYCIHVRMEGISDVGTT